MTKSSKNFGRNRPVARPRRSHGWRDGIVVSARPARLRGGDAWLGDFPAGAAEGTVATISQRALAWNIPASPIE
jgi:hypothetical protein